MTQPGTVHSSGPQFFVDTKKGEVNELRGLLQKFPFEKDIQKQRETIKKVIAYMTLGIDVSRLFTEMVKASKTPDLIIKKMIYLYLVNYSENNQECAILAINTFLTDCKMGDYKIRALALRTLSSLRFAGALTYIQQALSEGLKDSEAHVRKTAIIGCIKLYRQSPEIVKDGDYVETLYKLIKDLDAQVAINAIIALNEILEDEGGIAVTRKLIIYLLNRLKEFHEWGQALVIGLLARYEPKTDSEMLDILNILEDRLSHASPSVLLAATKVFMKYTKNSPVINKQVIERLQAPLITLMTSGETAGNYEITYVVIQHIHLIVSKYAVRPDTGTGYSLFQNDYKHFFCKMEEPTYIKDIKIEILSYIANETNMQDIINELSEYVIDVNADLAKKAITCISQIALRVPSMIKPIMQSMLKFFKFQTEYISSQVITVCAVLLRKYPQFIDDVIPFIQDLHNLITKTEAKVALIWILGEFGEKIPNAPYILENYAAASPNEPGLLDVFYALLTSTSKLFFKRPGECQPVLGNVMKQLIMNCENCDLRSRTIMYYNLFRSNVDLAQEIIVGKEPAPAIDMFLEDQENERKEKIEKEFNTFSVMYREPQEKFLKKELVQRIYQEELESDTRETKVKDKRVESPVSPVSPAAPTPAPPQQPVASVTKDLLDLDIGEYKSPDATEIPSSVTIPPAPIEIPSMELVEGPEIDPNNYQSSWLSIPNMITLTINLPTVPQSVQEVEAPLQGRRIYCIASGEAEGILKFYMYAQAVASKAEFFIELQIVRASRVLQANIKTNNQAEGENFKKMFETIINQVLI